MLTVVSPHEHSCYQGLDRMKRSGRVSERDTWMKEKIVGREKLPGSQMKEDRQPIRGCMCWPKEIADRAVRQGCMQAHTRADKVIEKGDKVGYLGEGWIGGRRILNDQEGG